MPIAARNKREGHQGFRSAAASLVVLGVDAVLLVVPKSATGFPLPFPLTYYHAVFTGFWAVVTAAVAKFCRPLERPAERSGYEEKFTFFQEARRKVIHVMLLTYCVAFTVGRLIFEVVWERVYGPQGWINTAEHQHNVENLAVGDPLLVGATVLTFALVCSCSVQASAEIVRHRFPGRRYPLRKTLELNRRPSERGTFITHMHLTPALLFASLVLNWPAPAPRAEHQGAYSTMAVIFVTALADMAAAIVGRRFGRHPWKVVEKKTIEGSAAGVVVAFVASAPFVGWRLGLGAGVVFLVTDVVLARANISDNLTTPVFLALLFALGRPWVIPSPL
ncbi:MAG: hypothetical protein Kow0069_36090 [Promethearchaeota archaeon]